MNLYLVRHGDAVSGGVDAVRALSPQGEEEIRELAIALGIFGVKPDVVLSSPLLRARQTAEILQQALSPEVSIESCELLVPGTPKEQLIQYLRESAKIAISRQAGKENVFLVGHLPHLGELLTLLVWGPPEREVPISKGGACHIEFEGAPRVVAGKLRWLLPKSILKTIAASRAE